MTLTISVARIVTLPPVLRYWTSAAISIPPSCASRLKRICSGLKPNEKELQKVFSDLSISWESIVEVEETVPDMWGGKWKTHLKAEAVADTLGAL
jgi:hypothetical protein